MSEHLGVKYKNISGNTWSVIYPSGFKTKMEAADEEELKAKIQALHDVVKDKK